MDFNFPILSLLVLTPIIGALTLSLTGSEQLKNKTILLSGLWISVGEFLLSLLLPIFYNQTQNGYQFIEFHTWFDQFDINYFVGVDGVSIPLILLTTFLIPICLLCSWNSIQTRVKEFVIYFLLLESFIIGVFISIDLVIFYVFFEAVLIPMFLIIGIWGGENRIYATFKFFLYTLAGSVLMLLAIIYIISVAKTGNIQQIAGFSFQENIQLILFLCFFASFAVKVPMFPFHTWLPDAHVQAPTSGSVILAGVLLKLGAYGFMRLSVPFFEYASIFYQPFIFSLSCVAIVYTSIVALRQDDMKKMIAYSSVAHMGFVTIGIFTLTSDGMNGAYFQMISHGVVSAALFLIVGVVYERHHTRMIADYSGVTNIMPKYSFFFMVFMLASVGLPGTSGFVGEFLVIMSTISVNVYLTVFTAIGVVLGAAYMLLLYKNVNFGEIKSSIKKLNDLTNIELFYFVCLAFLTILLGVYPKILFNMINESILQGIL
ncbi:MAG: NADH-quinone oxidoreductase subunit M [Pelagibacteraceae bacterium]